MILPDTSAWIEYVRGTDSDVAVRLRKEVSNGQDLCVTEPVIMEMTAGARSAEEERQLRRLMLRFKLLRFDSTTDFLNAARIYRGCREAGVTPRGHLDCMVAAVAIRNKVPVLARDADFERIAEVTDLQLT